MGRLGVSAGNGPLLQTALSGVTLKESNEEKTFQLSGLWAMPLASHFVERDEARVKIFTDLGHL